MSKSLKSYDSKRKKYESEKTQIQKDKDYFDKNVLIPSEINLKNKDKKMQELTIKNSHNKQTVFNLAHSDSDFNFDSDDE